MERAKVNGLPGAPNWAFGPERAPAITCPVLSVLDSRSSPLFVEGRQLLHAWFPACQDADTSAYRLLLGSHLGAREAP